MPRRQPAAEPEAAPRAKRAHADDDAGAEGARAAKKQRDAAAVRRALSRECRARAKAAHADGTPWRTVLCRELDGRQCELRRRGEAVRTGTFDDAGRVQDSRAGEAVAPREWARLAQLDTAGKDPVECVFLRDDGVCLRDFEEAIQTVVLADAPAPAVPGVGAPAQKTQAVARAHAPRTTLKQRQELFRCAHGPNGLLEGQRVCYVASNGEVALEGVIARCDQHPLAPPGMAPPTPAMRRALAKAQPQPSRASRWTEPFGILCECCDAICTPSQFEGHAGRAQAKAPYESVFTEAGLNLRELAEEVHGYGAVLPDGAEGPAQAVGGDTTSPAILPATFGACPICKRADYQVRGFGQLTMILCDGCEQEFHVGCLNETRGCELTCLPTGTWFCSERCMAMHCSLHRAVMKGTVSVEEGAEPGTAAPSTPPRTSGRTPRASLSSLGRGAASAKDAEYAMHVFHGRGGDAMAGACLSQSLELLTANFDPITDTATQNDLLPLMVYSRNVRDNDCRGFYTACVVAPTQAKGHATKGPPTVVAAAVFRALGPQLAEMPLIATRESHRCRGLCRLLTCAVERVLRDAGVERLVIPAAPGVEGAWLKIGYQRADDAALSALPGFAKVLSFPGSPWFAKCL